MRLIIAGGRDIEVSNFSIMRILVANKVGASDITEIISGGATGIDTCAEKFAKHMKFEFKLFKADWKKHGRAAGPLRNEEMAKNADALLLIWDGKSKGSANMKANAIKYNLRLIEATITQHSKKKEEKS